MHWTVYCVNKSLLNGLTREPQLLIQHSSSVRPPHKTIQSDSRHSSHYWLGWGRSSLSGSLLSSQVCKRIEFSISSTLASFFSSEVSWFHCLLIMVVFWLFRASFSYFLYFTDKRINSVISYFYFSPRRYRVEPRTVSATFLEKGRRNCRKSAENHRRPGGWNSRFKRFSWQTGSHNSWVGRKNRKACFKVWRVKSRFRSKFWWN